MLVARSNLFEKKFARLPKVLQILVQARVNRFAVNPFDPLLNNHPLRGKYLGCRSINLTGDLRAIYKPVSENSVYFLTLGTHHELYGS